MPADQEQRNHPRKDHHCLQNQQKFHAPEQHIKRQEQVEDRRKMHVHVRKQVASLGSSERHSGPRHVFVHLSEDAQVKILRIECAISGDRNRCEVGCRKACKDHDCDKTRLISAHCSPSAAHPFHKIQHVGIIRHKIIEKECQDQCESGGKVNVLPVQYTGKAEEKSADHQKP